MSFGPNFSGTQYTLMKGKNSPPSNRGGDLFGLLFCMALPMLILISLMLILIVYSLIIGV